MHTAGSLYLLFPFIGTAVLSDNFLRSIYGHCLLTLKCSLKSCVKLFLIHCYVFEIISYYGRENEKHIVLL